MAQQVSRSTASGGGVEGCLLVLAPLPLAALAWGARVDDSLWRLLVACAAALLLLTAGLLLMRRSAWGRPIAIAALTATFASLAPWLVTRPATTLAVSIGLILLGFAVAERGALGPTRGLRRNAPVARTRWATGAAVAASLLNLLAADGRPLYLSLAASGSGFIAAFLLFDWAWRHRAAGHRVHRLTVVLLAALLAVALVISLVMRHSAQTSGLTAAAIGAAIFFILPAGMSTHERAAHWYTPLLNHPARMLMTTFLGLCVIGTGGLLLPAATREGGIEPIDAAFTSVSAVCVTGLIVRDTPNDFTLFGQGFILLLIQLGGLGIMTISTVALHVLGRRLTVRQERLLHSMTESTEGDLVRSLVLVVKFTAAMELAGMVCLTLLFAHAGDDWPQAAWRGLFTSVSAFCNAGFALQTDSLIPYASSPLVLHIVGLLIIAGGLAPGVALLVPRWAVGRRVPAGARLVIVTTMVLLVGGFALILAMEWNRTLAHLSIADKVHNAWFQSVTLRTAGFNSIDIAQVAAPTLMVMLAFMFIGGSPGGTAGGVKTATVAILALAMWANITGRRDATIQERRIPPALVYRAVAVIGSGLVIWFALVLSLEITQRISPSDLVFEATSALATVGLSTGATGQLDDIGKVLIMVGMFLGRVGPMTLFMLLGDEPRIERHHRPDARIPIT